MSALAIPSVEFCGELAAEGTPDPKSGARRLYAYRQEASAMGDIAEGYEIESVYANGEMRCKIVTSPVLLNADDSAKDEFVPDYGVDRQWTVYRTAGPVAIEAHGYDIGEDTPIEMEYEGVGMFSYTTLGEAQALADREGAADASWAIHLNARQPATV